MKTEYDSFLDFIRDHIKATVEYETEHQDAGDNYSHLPREGGFDYGDGESRLRDYLAENEIELPAGVEFSDLVDFVLDNFEMYAGHIFGAFGRSGDFSVDSYAVGEVEVAFDLSALRDEFGAFARGFWLKASQDSEFCLRGDMSGGHAQGYAYESTDSVWYALVSADSIREWIAEQVAALVD